MASLQDLLARARRYHQDGAFLQAEHVYRQVLHVSPDHGETWFLLGSVCQAQGKLAEAALAYRQAAHLNPAFAGAHYQLGNVHAAQGQWAQAAACYQQVVELEPRHAEAHNNLAVAFAEQGRFTEALAGYGQALALNPTYAEAHYNQANAFKELGRWEEAAAGYRAALRLRPEFAAAHLNLGLALARWGKPADAVASYREALRLQPNYVEAHNNLGLALAHLGRHDQALAEYERALRLRPEFADAHYNRALSLLALGDFAQGWAEFEWRWQLAELPPRPFPQPRWDGTPLHGRTILLHSEQGLGDTIQFVRYAPLVQARGGRVLVACPDTLRPLLRSFRGIDQLAAFGARLPPFDVHCPLLSLGHVLGLDPFLSPAQVPYLQAEPGRVERWRGELSGLDGFKIGIAWQGSRGYRWDCLRSFPLAHFAPLAALPGVRLISLQKGPGSEQLQAGAGFPVLDLGSRLDEDGAAFVDTAAVLHSLDLVITSDTALVHLAGALGLPVWVVLALAPEWRWLVERDDSPWYPTLRLFRQRRFGDWPEVFERVAAAVRQRLGP